MFCVPQELNPKTQFSFTGDVSSKTKECKNRDCVETVCNLEIIQRILTFETFDNIKTRGV